jgi:N-acetylmuramoyl-L-alanine amidase
MRNINWIILHCTATNQNTTVESIQRYWREVLKWTKAPGYHLLIQPNGVPVRLAEDKQVCNGVAGHNANSIHISYIGGIDSKGKPFDNRTQSQRETMRTLVESYMKMYPNAKVRGHNDFTNLKACPSFKVSQWLKEVGL